MNAWKMLLMLPCLFGTPVFASDWLVLSDATLIDGSGSDARPISTISIKDGIIAGIDSQMSPTPGDVVTKIDLSGAFIIPGLIDTHVHVARFGDADVSRQILEQAVRGGVTSVRDLGGDARTLAELKREMVEGKFTGPTIAYSAVFGGASLFERDDRLSSQAAGYPVGESPWTRGLHPETDLALAVAEARGAGASGIKIYAHLDPSRATQLVTEARSQGLKTWAHATVFPTGPGALVEAGIDSLSHAPYLVWESAAQIPDDYEARIAGPWSEIAADDPALVSLYREMARRGVILDATLFIYRNILDFAPGMQAEWAKPAFEWARQAVGAAHENGVRISTGTDWFEPRPGSGLPNTHEEVALLVEAGLTPLEAIKAASLHGAIAMGIDGERGVIETGKAADLLVLDGNPLEDIRNTTLIRFVVKDGILIRPN